MHNANRHSLGSRFLRLDYTKIRKYAIYCIVLRVLVKISSNNSSGGSVIIEELAILHIFHIQILVVTPHIVRVTCQGHYLHDPRAHSGKVYPETN